MTKWRPGEYCDRCQNTGEVSCHCGGDLCVCENYGEMICPRCDGMSPEWAGADDFEDRVDE